MLAPIYANNGQIIITAEEMFNILKQYYTKNEKLLVESYNSIINSITELIKVTKMKED